MAFLNLQRLSVGFVATAVNRVLQVAGPLLLVPLFVAHLSVTEYGVWITILSITGYLGLLNLGITQVIVNVVTRDHARGCLERASPAFATGFFLYVGLSLVIWAAGSIALLMLCPEEHFACFPLWITATFFLAALPAQLFLGGLRGIQRVAEEQFFGAFSVVFRYIGMAAALVAGGKLWAIALIHGLAGLLPGYLAFWRLNRVQSALRIERRRFDRAMVGEILRPSSWFVVLQLAALLVWSIDTVLIAWLMGAAKVPAYAVPLQIILALQAMASIFTNSLTPHLVALISRQAFEEARQVYLDLLAVSLLVAACACVAIWIAGREALYLWAGPDIVPDEVTLFAMGVLLAIQCSIQPADGVLIGVMRHRGYALMSIAEGGVKLVLAVYGAIHYGISGVIIATVVGRLITNAWFLQSRASNILRLSTVPLLVQMARAFFLPVAVGLVTASLLRASGPSSHLIAGVAGATASGAVGLILNWQVIRRWSKSR